MVDVDILKDLIKQFMPFAQKHIGFENPPRLFLRSDPENAAKPLGKTAFYDPAKMCVTLYITDRHPKDVLRSLGHELVHHKQNCEGKFDDAGEMGEGYAQTNPHLRQMEIEANRDGSMCLRDFEDNLKKNNTIYFEHLQKGDKTMSTKDWKNQEIKSLLSEAWGFKMNLEQLTEAADNNLEQSTETVDENNDNVFAPNHYCVHHGGVSHNGSVQMAEAVNHNWNEELGRVTHYDMKLKDGTVLENVAFEDIQVTDASLAEGHHAHSAKRDDDNDDKDPVTEDSGAEEGMHYKDDSEHDDKRLDDMRDLVRQLEDHIHALEGDRDYDDEHVDESAEVDGETIEEGDEELEERATNPSQPYGAGRKLTDDDGQRYTTESVEAKMRDMVRQMIKDSMK